MQISKREKKMLAALGLILISFLYYQFGYQTLVNEVNKKSHEESEIKQKYNDAMETINNMENRKSDLKILNAKINDEASPIYPTFSQDHIILELDKLIKDSGLEGGMTFEKTEVKGVEEIKKSANDIDLPESSMQASADEYSNKYGEKNNSDETSNASQNKNVSANSNAPSETQAQSTTNSSQAANQKQNTVTQVKVNVDFNGKYENVVKFLNTLGKYERKIPVYTINMSTKNLDEVKGSINMMIYAIPKIDDEINKYLTWNLKNTYGKGQPFNVGSAAGTGIKSTDENSDFIVSANSINSDLPTVVIGRSNDTLRTTYVYGDSNKDQPAEIVLTKNGDKYYYKYKTANGSMPKDYNSLGSEFTPDGENININVLSQIRVTSSDNSGVKLKIINNTDKLVNVNISGDDSQSPRVSVDGDSTNISVNKK